jgi:hypothetical protein
LPAFLVLSTERAEQFDSPPQPELEKVRINDAETKPHKVHLRASIVYVSVVLLLVTSDPDVTRAP